MNDVEKKKKAQLKKTVKEAIAAKNLNQKQLADMINVSEDTLSKWLNPKYPPLPDKESRLKLEKTLGIDLRFLDKEYDISAIVLLAKVRVSELLRSMLAFNMQVTVRGNEYNISGKNPALAAFLASYHDEFSQMPSMREKLNHISPKTESLADYIIFNGRLYGRYSFFKDMLHMRDCRIQRGLEEAMLDTSEAFHVDSVSHEEVVSGDNNNATVLKAVKGYQEFLTILPSKLGDYMETIDVSNEFQVKKGLVGSMYMELANEMETSCVDEVKDIESRYPNEQHEIRKERLYHSKKSNLLFCLEGLNEYFIMSELEDITDCVIF